MYILQALGIRLGSFIEVTVILVASIIIALVYSWSLTLIILGLVPLIAVATSLQSHLLAGAATSAKKGYEDSTSVSECTSQELIMYIPFCTIT